MTRLYDLGARRLSFGRALSSMGSVSCTVVVNRMCRCANYLAVSSLALIGLQTASVAAQVILSTPADPVASDSPPFEGELPVSLDRIRRALDRPVDPSHARLLDLAEYVFVVADAPELSLPDNIDVRGAGPTVGAPTHAEMVAITRPSGLDQAIGSDALGVATSALSTLVPQAIRAIAGWFSRDVEDPLPSWIGYTGTFVLGPTAGASPQAHTLVFHRLAGQRVSVDASVSHPPGVGVGLAIDGQEWGVLEQEVADRTVPNQLLRPESVGNLHTLTLSRVPGTLLDEPLTIELLLVVHERVEP